MAPIIVIIAVLAVAAYWANRTIRQYYALKSFGGHWSAGWSRLWLLKTVSSGRMNHLFTEMNDKYGSTVRIAPHFLITADPDLLKKMNAVRGTFTRSEWYTALRLHPTRDNITSTIDEGVHASIRSKMAPGYSGKENTHVEKDVDDRIHNLLALIEKSYLSTDSEYRPIDISRTLTFFTLDVISQVAFGHQFGFLDIDDDPFGYIAQLKQFLPAILLFGSYTELQKILQLPIMKFALPNVNDKRGLGRVMGFAKERVDERFGDKPIVRRDMLGSFIKHGMTQEELESETLTQITAGSDSTASALRMTLHYVCTNPEVLAKLLAEANNAIAAGQISRPLITDVEARKLPYLQACIKEGLRIYPPVTGLLAKQVPPEGVTIDGKFAPGGTWIGQNPWAMQRNKEIYGQDVEIFRPERWFPVDGSAAEKSRVDRMTDTVGLVFGYGRFGCLGRGVATMELNKALIELLLRFNFQPCSLAKPFEEQCIGFYIHDDMMFRVTKRSEESSRLSAFAVGSEVSALPGAPEE